MGGSVPGWVSSIGNAVAPAGAAGSWAGAGVVPASGEGVALLALGGALVRPAVLARMARSKRFAASTSVVILPAMMSVAGADYS